MDKNTQQAETVEQAYFTMTREQFANLVFGGEGETVTMTRDQLKALLTAVKNDSLASGAWEAVYGSTNEICGINPLVDAQVEQQYAAAAKYRNQLPRGLAWLAQVACSPAAVMVLG